MGDGALVYFGYPQAHEDDAERATRCGLALVDRVRNSIKPKSPRASRDRHRAGCRRRRGGRARCCRRYPNLAARLQAVAQLPDTLVIAASTRRLVGDLFEYRYLGEIELKGIAGLVSAWQPLRTSSLASRFEALRGSALSPLVGRDEEIDLLLRRWARSRRVTAKSYWFLASLASASRDLSRQWRSAPRRASSPPALLLLALSSGQRSFSLYRRLAAPAGFSPDDPTAARLGEVKGPTSRSLSRRTTILR